MPHEPSRNFARSVGGFTSATVLSRLLGFARDSAVVYCFGGGALTDSFYAAFRIANFFRRTLGEGALASSFVPVLSREAQKGEGEARAFMRSLTSASLLASAALALLGILFARPIVGLLTYGFKRDPALFELTVLQTRILFPHVIFITMAALLQGTLNVKGRFFAAAAAPALFSLSILAYLGALKAGWLPLLEPRAQLLGLSVAAMLGGAWAFAALFRPAREAFGFGLGPLGHPGLRTVGTLMVPAFVGMAADHVGTFMNTVCASFLEPGSMTAIYNSSRLMQLPLALFGVATASVALPRLSEQAGRADLAGYRDTLGLGLRLASFLLWPSMVGLWAIDLPLIRVLFEHGRFGFEASLLTHQALEYAVLAIFAYAASKILVSGFYALHDSKTPVLVGAATAALNAGLAVALMGPLKVGGLTLASAIAAWAECGLLAWALHRKTGFLGRKAVVEPLLKSLAAALVMGAAVRSVMAAVPASPGIQVAAALAAAPVVYFGAAWLLGIEERHLVLGLLKRRPATADEVASL